MRTHQTQHADTPDDLCGYFESCSEPRAFWCGICAEVEVLAPGVCPTCQAALDCQRDADEIARLDRHIAALLDNPEIRAYGSLVPRKGGR